jgi:3-deoxy-manno-octulosonate cytidylyltransferase (CMP-KDO synthetase)
MSHHEAEARAVAIIPARLASSRFPGKVLADATGRPLIQYVWDAARRATSVQRVVVATDDPRVRSAVEAFGGECLMTSPDHESGTSRIAEAADILELPGDTIVVNVQGDEPELDPEWIDAAAGAVSAGLAPMGTIAVPFADDDDPEDPTAVKVALRHNGTALYFSRALIPFPRERGESSQRPPFLKHIGIYALRRPFLATFVTLEPTALERTEMLEQLRALYYGYDIAVAVRDGRSHGGIDTPEQYEAFVSRQRSR